MAKLQCRCGNLLSNSLVPSEIVLHLFTDKKMDEILVNDSIMTIELHNLSTELWRCPNCDRVYKFDENGRVSKIYIPEKL